MRASKTVLALAMIAMPAMAAEETVPAPSNATAEAINSAAAPTDAAPAETKPSPEASVAPATAQAPAALPAGLSAPMPGKGQIVFFRKGGFVGSAISCAVHENGTKVSSLPPGRFFVLQTDPGVHSYSVKSEATDTLRLEVEDGETYFAKCAITMGIMAGRPNLSPTDAATYAQLSAKLKPVEAKKP